jgi:hypothetical protein
MYTPEAVRHCLKVKAQRGAKEKSKEHSELNTLNPGPIFPYKHAKCRQILSAQFNRKFL